MSPDPTRGELTSLPLRVIGSFELRSVARAMPIHGQEGFDRANPHENADKLPIVQSDHRPIAPQTLVLADLS